MQVYSMCNPGLTKHFQENPNGLFLERTLEYLGLQHGDTESHHPYVRGDLSAVYTPVTKAALVQEPKAPVAVVSVAAVKISSTVPVKAPMGWHAEYCMNKFGKMTPGA